MAWLLSMMMPAVLAAAVRFGFTDRGGWRSTAVLRPGDDSAAQAAVSFQLACPAALAQVMMLVPMSVRTTSLPSPPA